MDQNKNYLSVTQQGVRFGLDNSSNNVCAQSKIQSNQILVHIVNDYITESTTITWYAMLSNMKIPPSLTHTLIPYEQPDHNLINSLA